MIIKIIFIILLFSTLLLIFNRKRSIRIIIEKQPQNTPKPEKFYLASNLNQWNAQSEEYQFQKSENGLYELKINGVKKPFEYKITRGSWQTVETSKNGQDIENRIFTSRTKVQKISIQNWNDLIERKSTALPNVKILDAAFPIKTLNTNRKIWIYLPNNYEKSTENYPVLYMHDGQNLFDILTANNTEWQVDKTLSKLENLGKLKLIVVGINHGEAARNDEYTPWKNQKYGGGKGSEYIDFIVKELKPFVDKNYRTQASREFTGMMGSSLGGLITMYAGMKYSQVFGRLGIFSPSFWWSDESYKQAKKTGFVKDTKIFMNVGKSEHKIMKKGTKTMEKTLKSIGYSDTNLQTRYVEGGKHTEAFWQKEFEAAVLWLFQ